MAAGEAPFGSFGGQPIQSCRTTIAEFQKNGFDYSTFYLKANSYTCQLGHEHGTAWLLMRAEDLAKMNSAMPQDLILGIGTKDPITIKNLAIISSQKLVPMESQSKNSLHLVQAVDVRWFLRRTTINKRYNLRKLDTQSDWITGTLFSTGPNTPWTFSQICQDIWTNFAAFGMFFSAFSSWSSSNIYGTLPTDNPENLRFESISALDALASLCQQFGFFLRYDPTLGQLLILKIGYTPDPFPGSDGWYPSGFGGSRTLLSGAGSSVSYFPVTPIATPRSSDDGLTEDTESFFGVPYIPDAVQVAFYNNGEGRSEVADVDSNAGRGWTYVVEKTAAAIHADPLTGTSFDYLNTTIAGTKVILYSSTYAQYASATITVPSNLTDLQSIAKRMAADYYRTAAMHAISRLTYGGIIDVIPGPVICEVTWADWGDGLRTRFARMPIPVGLPKMPKIFVEDHQDSTGGTGGSGCCCQELSCLRPTGLPASIRLTPEYYEFTPSTLDCNCSPADSEQAVVKLYPTTDPASECLIWEQPHDFYADDPVFCYGSDSQTVDCTDTVTWTWNGSAWTATTGSDFDCGCVASQPGFSGTVPGQTAQTDCDGFKVVDGSNTLYISFWRLTIVEDLDANGCDETKLEFIIGVG